jgi:hypothetical protein
MLTRTEYSRRWRQANPERDKELHRLWYLRNKERISRINREWKEAHPEDVKREGRERLQKKRMIVLTHYSGNPPKCACCDEKNYEFLAIDHINNDGGKHRKETGLKGGNDFVSWLIKNNFPEGFQILCHNCNMAKGFYGYCPHKKVI